MRRLALLLIVVGVLTVAGTTVPTAASPQPTPFCPYCGDHFADAAAGTEVTVERSTVDVRIHRNGSATWTVRNELDNASAFREYPSLLEYAARNARPDYARYPVSPTYIGSRMDGDTAVVTYRDDRAASRHAGLLVVSYFHDTGDGFLVNADRVQVRGPDGQVVTNDPQIGRVEQGDYVIRGFTPEGEWYTESTFVVFGSDDGVVTQARSIAAVQFAAMPTVADSAGSFLFPQMLAFGASLVVVGLLLRVAPTVSASFLSRLLLVLGVAGSLPVVASDQPSLAVFPLFALGLGLVGILRQRRPHLRARTTRPGQLLAVAVSIGAASAFFALLLGVLFAPESRFSLDLWTALKAVAVTLPFAALLPLGRVVDERLPVAIRWFVLAVVAFAFVPPLLLDFADPPTGMGGGLAAVFLVVAGLVVPILGSPVALLGGAFGDDVES